MQDSIWAFLIQRSVEELRPRARRYGEIAYFVFDETRPVEVKSQPNNRVDVSFGLLVMPMQISLPEITAVDLDNDMPLSDANKQSVWRQIGKSYFTFIARRDLQNQCFLQNLEACAQRSDLNEIDLPFFCGKRLCPGHRLVANVGPLERLQSIRAGLRPQSNSSPPSPEK